jgi:hypothetical protein
LVVEQIPLDVQGVSDLLREADLVCTPVGISDEGFDPYHLPDYHVQEHIHGCKGQFLLDLNVLRRVNSLHPDAGVTVGKQERVAAALMAFGIFANVQMEPGLAVMEWFSPQQRKEIAEQVRTFRALDNTDPDLFADIALGKAERLPKRRIPRQPPVKLPDVPMRPTGWHFDYTALLKVAILTITSEQQSRTRAAVMEEYLNWCWADFLFSSPAIQFGGLYLSPLRRKRMFKKLRSGDAQKALAGIQNATWDLAYLREWGKRTLQQQGTERFHFFCSLDQALRESAREFLMLGNGSPVETHEAMWKRLWGDRDGQRLMEVYLDLEAKQEDPQRAWNSGSTTERAEQLTKGLEGELTQLVESL